MQAPLHFLVGLLIGKTSLPFLLAFVLVFLSHFLVDAFAKITYHVPDPQPEDRFWVGYHIIVYLLTIILFFVHIEYFWMFFASILVDIIDWGILRGILKKPARIHPIIDKIRESVPFKYLPDLNYQKWAIIPEIILFAAGYTLFLLF